MVDAMRIKITGAAGIDLQRGGAGGPGAVGVVFGLLVTFNEAIRIRSFKVLMLSTSKGVLPAPGLKAKFNTKYYVA